MQIRTTLPSAAAAWRTRRRREATRDGRPHLVCRRLAPETGRRVIHPTTPEAWRSPRCAGSAAQRRASSRVLRRVRPIGDAPLRRTRRSWESMAMATFRSLTTHGSTEMYPIICVDTEIRARAVAEVVLAAPPKPARPWPCPRSAITHLETGETERKKRDCGGTQTGGPYILGVLLTFDIQTQQSNYHIIISLQLIII